MQRSTHIRYATTSPHIGDANRGRTAREQTDIFEALIEALTSGERYRLLKRDGELHLIARSE